MGDFDKDNAGEGPAATPSPQEEADREAIAALTLRLRSGGIRDNRVLSAIERVPRRLFLSAALQKHAHTDTALPIECGQTISQPTVVAWMTAALDIAPEHKVLEVGTGSGYQAAVLGHLSREVHSIERYRTLADLARERLSTLKIASVTVHHGDGLEGLPEKAPFDRIIVTAAGPEIPPALLDQLADGGKLIMPVGPKGGVQVLTLAEKKGATMVTRALQEVRFVPLVEGVASRL
ncbi:protein-L-isoaspartate(D-aspartate) O-methyltransferase [Stappia indica]|uniref:protein-L-isoaspartate(D-aspartate) O-methyltransferase n=1 Tax=Stappia indica TaxID=538381 RepID=UPI001CD4E9FD|nr:protein-L-isoaspartate(D-aspartate) O-methyltransferase [Stappia indica]MCA1296918.1 protein-L-isoaspartate(D-aspartate) O-methyltransferase [Stappia indica]